MKRNYKISEEEAAEIREKLKTTKKKSVCRRLEAVALLGEGKTPAEVASIKQYSEKHVRNLGLLYHKEGIEALGSDGRRGGNHRMMKPDESAAFLKQFEEQARDGKVLTVEEIARALDEHTGKKRKSLSTTYGFLHRHGWRKVMPRSKHPKKASDEEVETSKKLRIRLQSCNVMSIPSTDMNESD